MSGMTTTLNTADVYQYSSRTAVIEVTGLCRQDIMRTSNYIVKVPYSQLSNTIQRISRTGGKVSHVEIVSFNLDNSQNGSSTDISSARKDTDTSSVTDSKESPDKENSNNSIPEIESSKYLANFEDNPPKETTKTKTATRKKAPSKRKTSRRKRNR